MVSVQIAIQQSKPQNVLMWIPVENMNGFICVALSLNNLQTFTEKSLTQIIVLWVTDPVGCTWHGIKPLARDREGEKIKERVRITALEWMGLYTSAFLILRLSWKPPLEIIF